MAENLQSLRRRLESTRDLQSLVKTMRALAAINIRQYDEMVASLRGYSRTVELGLQVLMQQRPPGQTLPEESDTRNVGAVVVGSDQGMCGQFNDDAVGFARERLEAQGLRPNMVPILVLGERTAGKLEEEEIPYQRVLPVSTSAGGVKEVVQQVLLQVETWNLEERLEPILLFHLSPASAAAYEPVETQLLPLSRSWLEELGQRRWRSRSLPKFSADWPTLLSHYLRQYLLVTIQRAIAESMAAENAARMRSMQAAEKNIGEHLEELTEEYHQQRQTSITAELLDIAAGFEALTGSQM